MVMKGDNSRIVNPLKLRSLYFGHGTLSTPAYRHPRPNLGHQPPSQITKKQNPTGTLEFVLHFSADSYHLSFCPRRASWKIKRKFLFYRSFTGGLDLLFSFSLPISPPFNIVYYFRREVVSFNMKNLHSDRSWWFQTRKIDECERNKGHRMMLCIWPKIHSELNIWNRILKNVLFRVRETCF